MTSTELSNTIRKKYKSYIDYRSRAADAVAAQSAAETDRLAMEHTSDPHYYYDGEPRWLPDSMVDWCVDGKHDYSSETVIWKGSNEVSIQCRWCRSHAADDSRGNCGACGAPR